MRMMLCYAEIENKNRKKYKKIYQEKWNDGPSNKKK